MNIETFLFCHFEPDEEKKTTYSDGKIGYLGQQSSHSFRLQLHLLNSRILYLFYFSVLFCFVLFRFALYKYVFGS